MLPATRTDPRNTSASAACSSAWARKSARRVSNTVSVGDAGSAGLAVAWTRTSMKWRTTSGRWASSSSNWSMISRRRCASARSSTRSTTSPRRPSPSTAARAGIWTRRSVSVRPGSSNGRSAEARAASGDDLGARSRVGDDPVLALPETRGMTPAKASEDLPLPDGPTSPRMLLEASRSTSSVDQVLATEVARRVLLAEGEEPPVRARRCGLGRQKQARRLSAHRRGSGRLSAAPGDVRRPRSCRRRRRARRPTPVRR